MREQVILTGMVLSAAVAGKLWIRCKRLLKERRNREQVVPLMVIKSAPAGEYDRRLVIFNLASGERSRLLQEVREDPEVR